MQLERIGLRLRRRNGWEALDLGQVMLRAWAAPAYRAWCATYLPFAVSMLLLATVSEAFANWAALFIWWLKPAFDRVLLHVYSRSLFGEATSVRDIWRALPGLLKNSGLLRGLTIGRLSLARSFLLPVWQLEGNRGKEARERARVLGINTRGHAVWITVFCANLSTFLAISIVLVIAVLTPEGAGSLIDWDDLRHGQLGPARLFALNLIVQIAESVVEPLYVASGFSLYLSRRTELEGWDIELGLRRLAARREAETRAHSITASLVVALAFAGALMALPAPPAVAAEGTPPSPIEPGASESKRVIAEVLADPVFGREVDDWQWRWRSSDTAQPSGIPAWLRPWLQLVEWLAKAGRMFVWFGGIILLALLIWLAWRYRDAWVARNKTASRPDFLFGLDVRPDSLPADVAAAARAALADGRIDLALSLLYRGALVALIHRADVEFLAGDTESDCLTRVRGRIGSEALDYFGRLLRAWQLAAYAHRTQPADALKALCDEWARHFAHPGTTQ